MKRNSGRRGFIKNVAALGVASLPLSAFAESALQTGRLKIVCVGGHPDDPESGCGGTLAKLKEAGHEVKILYLTKGEAGISGKTHQQSADIRTKEAEAACKILNVSFDFLGQIDGDTVFNSEWIRKITTVMENEKPDIVFTQWPIDTHKDHQVASLLTIQARLTVKKKFQLYFYEVCAGEQTMSFHPTEYVDITSAQEIKRKALYCHVSQDPPGIYECGHEIMENFRGREAGFKAAEAFVKFNGSSAASSIM
jgi:LmbE family N-acetylglucosaminyl deacetylase